MFRICVRDLLCEGRNTNPAFLHVAGKLFPDQVSRRFVEYLPVDIIADLIAPYIVQDRERLNAPGPGLGCRFCFNYEIAEFFAHFALGGYRRRHAAQPIGNE